MMSPRESSPGIAANTNAFSTCSTERRQLVTPAAVLAGDGDARHVSTPSGVPTLLGSAAGAAAGTPSQGGVQTTVKRPFRLVKTVQRSCDRAESLASG